MARVDNLNHFLTDVADAIRTKSGSSDLISAEDFDTAITNIPTSGGDPNDYFDGDYAGSSTSPEYNYFRESYVKASSINFPDIDCTGKTTLQTFFKDCKWSKLPRLKNTGSITNMSEVFSGCNYLTSIDVSRMDTSNVTNMQSMFYGCSLLESLDLSNFDFSKVTTLNSFLSSVTRINSVNMGSSSSPLLTNMAHAFANCFTYNTQASVSLDISNLDLSKVTTIESAFLDTANNEHLDSIVFPALSSGRFFSNALTNMGSAFSGRTHITTLPFDDLDTSGVTNWNSTFYNCQSLVLDGVTFDLTAADTLSQTFVNCRKLKSVTFTNITKNLYVNNVFGGSAVDFSSADEIAKIRFEGDDTGKQITLAGNSFSNMCASYGNTLLLEFDGIGLNHQTTSTSSSVLPFRQCYANKLIIKGAKIIQMNLISYNSYIHEVYFTDCDWSQCTRMYRTFYYGGNNLKKVVIPDLTGLESISFQDTFFQATTLEHLDIRGMLFSQGAPTGIFDTTSTVSRIPDNCEIIVKDDTEKAVFTAAIPRYTNVKTVAEYEAEQNA